MHEAPATMTTTAPEPIRPVILSGGCGTRLWPMSRTDWPKQLLPLLPPDTMLQASARRVTGPGFLPPYVIANAQHVAAISAQLGESGVPADALILEPVRRNTAPAIALAAALAAETGPDTLLLVMPSDHVIADIEAFHRAIRLALPIAGEGWLVTFGIRPSSPATGYGYIEIGESRGPGIHRAVRFVEKPDRATAERYLASGQFAWNSGIFLFRADAILTALDHNAPNIGKAALSAIAGARRQGAIIRPDPVAFAASPSQSIDYAVMEHWDRIAVVPVDMGWSDIGCWDALLDCAAPCADEADESAASGNVVAIDTKNCLIRSSGPLVAVVGITDLIVVATDDAVMVAPRGRSQDIRKLVSELERRNHPAVHHSIRKQTSWGHFRLLTRAGKIEVHEAVVNPGAVMTHFMDGSARFTVLAGAAMADGRQYQPGDSFGPLGQAQATIANTGPEPLHLLARTERQDG